MNETSMGPIGLALAFAGGALLWWGHIRIARSLEGLGEQAERSERRLWWAVLPVAALRIRWLGSVSADPIVVKQHRFNSLMQMTGSWITFVGCARYLLRP